MKEKEVLRILHVTVGMDRGGIENFLMNIYRKVDRKKIQFDFLIHLEEEQAFEREILELGGKIYRTPALGKVGPFKYQKALNNFFKEHDYKIVHSHYNAVNGVILNEAKKCGIKNRISHSHTSYPKYRLFEKLYKEYYSKFLLKFVATKKYACSKKAGQWLYKSNFEVINNGIDTKEYSYKFEERLKVRNELKIAEEKIVIGHIGRFVDEKNHRFLIEIFKKLYKKNKNYSLIMIGDGVLKKEIEENLSLDKELFKNVYFLGIREDVKNLLQGMDIMIFPSKFEGLPVALVEAQGSGLKCFVSKNVSEEIDLGCNLVTFIGLDKPVDEWVEIIEKNIEYKRRDTVEYIKKAGYDVSDNANYLEKMYLNLE